MNQLVVWMACYGMTFLCCDAKLVQAARQSVIARSDFMRGLLECYFCTGFWMSLAVQLFIGRTKIDHPAEYLQEVLIGSFAGATFCFSLNSLLLYLEAKAHDRNHPEE